MSIQTGFLVLAAGADERPALLNLVPAWSFPDKKNFAWLGAVRWDDNAVEAHSSYITQ